MSKQVAIRRGTASEQAAFVGTQGEISYNTTDKRLSAHDGSRLGGYPAIHENGSKGLNLNLTGNITITGKSLTLNESSNAFNERITSTGIYFSRNGKDLIKISSSPILNGINGDTSIAWSDRILYQSNGQASLSWGNNYLYNNNLLSLSWADRYLADSNEILSLDWENRYLYETGGNFQVIDGKLLTLNRNFGNNTAAVTIDWNNCKNFDKNKQESIDWNYRQLTDSNNSVLMHWTNGLYLTNGIGDLAVSIPDRSLYNTVGDDVFNWNNGVIKHTSTNINSIDWNQRNLYDELGIRSIDYNQRIFRDSVEIICLDWDNKALSDGINSVAWAERALYTNNIGVKALDWQNLILTGIWKAQELNIPNSFSGLNKVLVDNNKRQSLNWNTRQLNDTGNSLSLNWSGRTLVGTNNNTVMNWGQNPTLSGNWSAQNISISGRNLGYSSLSYLDNDLYLRTQMGAKGMMKHANSHALRSFRDKLAGTGLLKVIRGGDGFTNIVQDDIINGVAVNLVGVFDRVINNLFEIYGTGGSADRHPYFREDISSSAAVDYITDDPRLDSEFITEHFAITKPTGYIEYHHFNSNYQFLTDKYDIYYVSNTGAGGLMVDTGLYGGSYARYTGINASGNVLDTRKLTVNMGNPNFYQLRISGSGNTSYLLLPTVTAYNSTASSGRLVLMDYTRDAGPQYGTSFIDIPGSQRTNIRDTVFSGFNPDLMLWIMSSATSQETGHRHFFNSIKTKWPNCAIVTCGLFPYNTGNEIQNMSSRKVAVEKGYPYFDGYNTFENINVWSGRGFSRSNLGTDPHPTGAGIIAYGQMLWNFLEF